MRTLMEDLLQSQTAPGSGPAATATNTVSWSAILAGAFVAIGASIILLTLGSGLGYAAAPAWPPRGASAASLTTAAAIWLIVTQWLSAALGGYIAGRLRGRWMGTHSHEVFFRDTAHGLVTWAVATVAVAALVGGTAASAGSESGAVLDAAARDAAAQAAIYTALSLLVGAFIACVSAALGGRLRDEHA
jgi:hypothetical protein